MKRAPLTHLEPDELLDVLRAAREHCVRDWALILVGYWHGCRAQELANLKLADIDLRNREICINRLKGSLCTTQPLGFVKGQPLLDEHTALRRWLQERQDASDYLFSSQKGGRLDRSAIFRLFCAACERASTQRRKAISESKWHPHVLKHSRASHLVGKTDITNIQATLGHKRIQSTMVYSHLDTQAAWRASQTAVMEVF